ncbi:peptidase S8/S53 domain-containing protein [Haematococcus lacustris]
MSCRHSYRHALTSILADTHAPSLSIGTPHLVFLRPCLPLVVAEGGVTRVLLLALGAKPTDQTAVSWAASLAMELTAALPQAVPACYPIVKAVGTTGAVEVAVCLPDVDAAVSWLATQPSVTWVEYVTQGETTNLLASAQMQTGRVTLPVPDVVNSRGFHPLWAAGLDGAGQLVGTVDTGLDMDSCFFWDPAFANFSSDPANLYTDPATGTTYFHNNTHRKVPYYFGQSDFIDGWGHGTLTGGAVAGSPYGFHPTRQPNHATGQAPAAKLAIVDLGQGGNPSVFVDPNLELTLGPLYRAGARIISNPWGAGDFSYTAQQSFLLDTYVWSRPDLLLVFPAGNEGDEPDTQLTGNVVSTALAKNVVAVGATDNYTPLNLVQSINLLGANNSQVQIPSRFMKPYQYVVKAKAVNQSQATQAEAVVSLLPWLAPPVQWSSLQNRTLELVLADPLLACTPLVGNYTGKVVLAIRGACPFDTKGHRIVASGASAGIVFNSLSSLLLLEGRELANSSIPLMGMSGRQGRQLMDMFANGWNVTLTSYQDPYSNVLSSSSYGATLSSNESVAVTQDVRIKPDIVTPGTLLSAFGNDGYSGRMDMCTVGTNVGTSMACASAAGAATLVRQYFTDGYYPTGARVRSNAFNPSASLLKAMLVASTTNMSSFTSSGLTPYDVRHGFGFMNIGRILPLRGGPATSKLQVVDRAMFNSSGQSHTYSVHAASQRALIITLAYMDWPAFPGVGPTLVNNLDLRVTTPSGAVLWGNDVRGGDRMNNVEKLVIPRPQSGVYFIQVDATNLFIDARPQPYSLVVQGAINTLRTSRRSASH